MVWEGVGEGVVGEGEGLEVFEVVELRRDEVGEGVVGEVEGGEEREGGEEGRR